MRKSRSALELAVDRGGPVRGSAVARETCARTVPRRTGEPAPPSNAAVVEDLNAAVGAARRVDGGFFR
jgi:hypothetical protein